MTGEVKPFGEREIGGKVLDLDPRASAETDWQLLARVESDPEALAELFHRHRDFVFRVACSFLLRRELAEDVVQEVFLRLVQRSSSLHERASLRTLLFGFVRNVSRERRRQGSREDELIPERHDRSSPPEGAAGAPLTADVWGLLPKLPQRQREVIVLRLMEGLTTRETAETLGCGEGAVKTHLHRATRALRELLVEPGSGSRRGATPGNGKSK